MRHALVACVTWVVACGTCEGSDGDGYVCELYIVAIAWVACTMICTCTRASGGGVVVFT